MATLTITIKLDNAAFHNDATGEPEPGPEVARILHRLADSLDCLVVAPRGPEPLELRDINGNTCGTVTVTA